MLIFLSILSFLLLCCCVICVITVFKFLNIISEFEEDFGVLYERIQEKESSLNNVAQNSMFYDNDEVKSILEISRSIRIMIHDFFETKGKKSQ